MRTRLRAGAAWCGVIALVAAGCGGGGGRLSAPGYVRAASHICSSANRAVGRVAIPSLDDARLAARAMGRVVVIQRDSIDGLRGLKPPEQLSGLSQRWIALLDQSTDELDRMRASLSVGKGHLAEDFAGKAEILLDRAHVLVSARGMTSCRGPAIALG